MFSCADMSMCRCRLKTNPEVLQRQWLPGCISGWTTWQILKATPVISNCGTYQLPLDRMAKRRNNGWYGFVRHFIPCPRRCEGFGCQEISKLYKMAHFQANNSKMTAVCFQMIRSTSLPPEWRQQNQCTVISALADASEDEHWNRTTQKDERLVQPASGRRDVCSSDRFGWGPFCFLSSKIQSPPAPYRPLKIRTALSLAVLPPGGKRKEIAIENGALFSLPSQIFLDGIAWVVFNKAYIKCFSVALHGLIFQHCCSQRRSEGFPSIVRGGWTRVRVGSLERERERERERREKREERREKCVLNVFAFGFVSSMFLLAMTVGRTLMFSLFYRAKLPGDIHQQLFSIYDITTWPFRSI